MSRVHSEPGLMPSILDRLVDPQSLGTIYRPGYSLEQMIEAVRGDVEDLLNSRRVYPDVPEEFTEVWKSILVYGLPDFASMNAFTPEQREEVGRMLERAIRTFEPRLTNVRAMVLDGGDPLSRTVRFRIEAQLRVDPAPAIALETTLDLGSRRYSIEATGG
jgi:type VI secretion system protein ImpF